MSPDHVQPRPDRHFPKKKTLLAALLVIVVVIVLGNLTGSQASASSLPIVFPLEHRVTLVHLYMVPRSGHLHEGMDLWTPKMTRQMAVVSGTVTLYERTYIGQPWYSLWLAGDDGHGYYYSHINNDTPGTDDGQGGLEYAFAPGVVTGSRVTQGQFLAYSGDSGNAEKTSPHLHFEIHQTSSVDSPCMDPYDSLREAPLADGTPASRRPAARLTRYEQSDTKITYTGRWTPSATTGASGGTYAWADSLAGALIWFEGTRLELIATKGATEGKAWVSVDDGPPTLVDLYSGVTKRGQVVWSSGELVQGTHTITVTRAGWPGVAGGGSRINIDAVDVVGTLIQAPVLARFQQQDSRLAYEGAWVISRTALASGGSFRFAKTSDSSVTAQFTGIYAAWIAKKGPTYGKATISLDGEPPVVVNLYSASALYQQVVWNSGLIPYGVHTLKIEWTGLKDQAASGTTIGIDALQLIGDLNVVGSGSAFGPTAGTIIEPPALSIPSSDSSPL